MPFGIGHWELIALAVVLLALFGSKRLPELARTLGGGLREVRESVAQADLRNDVRELAAPADEGDDPADGDRGR